MSFYKVSDYAKELSVVDPTKVRLSGKFIFDLHMYVSNIVRMAFLFIQLKNNSIVSRMALRSLKICTMENNTFTCFGQTHPFR